ncbi:hypothetical protein AAVH_25114 [Aphelenchoides avenae]|nr:hypothetical protein AAVH_25114 [Aphelenchus avenae]
MLPNHVFADVVGYLRLYDLDALLLTDARCSGIAHSAASQIRVFDFSEFRFDLYNSSIVIYKLAQAAPNSITLNFLNATDLVHFIPAALRNCVLGGLTAYVKGSFDATTEVADTIIIKGTLTLDAPRFANAQVLVECVVSLRSVQERAC